METKQNESLATESLDTSTISHTSQVEPEKHDSLPRGSELSLRTIRLLASDIIKTQTPLPENVTQDARIIIQEIDELIGRLEKRRIAKEQQQAA